MGAVFQAARKFGRKGSRNNLTKKKASLESDSHRDFRLWANGGRYEKVWSRSGSFDKDENDVDNERPKRSWR